MGFSSSFVNLVFLYAILIFVKCLPISQGEFPHGYLIFSLSPSSRNMDNVDYGTMDSKGSNTEVNRPSTLPRPQRIIENKKPVNVHIHVKAILEGITIGASLLPSLRAQYKVHKGNHSNWSLL